MNKPDMIEEIIREHPIELLLDALWEDVLITKKVKTSLQKVSEANLIPYHDQFVGHHNKTRSNITAEHTPTFKGGIPTQEYIEYMHIN